ncbi:MAG: OmpA family protein [Bacteroidota bacterium]|nr:OmpA family protein [Bacteroidota bacterium]
MTITSRNILLLLLLLGMPLVLSAPAHAQLLEDKSTPMRFSGRLLSLSAGGGPASYFGEFEGGMGGLHAAAAIGYAVFPELTLALTADVGSLPVTRRPEAVARTLYDFQFFSPGDDIVESGIAYTAFDLSAQLNLFPRRFHNLFLSAGVGVTLYRAEDFDDARLRPSADFPATLAIPVGVGYEHFLYRNLSVTVLLRNTFLLTGDFDAYDGQEVATEYNRRAREDQPVPSGFGDSYAAATVGVRFYLFESGDFDGDLLPNEEEVELGTSPYDIDTDVDGLTDFEEVRVYATSPLRPDTDDDGLGDYFEITKYGTDPLRPDTDEDQLSDADEVLLYNTDPLKPDTDDDMLSDYEEVILYTTNPRNPDTDYDGLDDYAEVKVYETDPLRPDTDDDGIFDFNEVVTYRTNPREEDTDGDILLDYDEIAYYGTNPLSPDTDGDSVGDASEVFGTRTNPLDGDTASVLPRPVHRPTAQPGQPYYAELIETRPLPGGGVSYLIAPVVTRRQSRQSADIDSIVAALPRLDSTFARRAGESNAEAYARYRRRSVQHVQPPAEEAGTRKPLRLDSLQLRQGDLLAFSDITFEFDRDELREEYAPILREAVRLFEIYPSMVVEIRGHTDTDGEEWYNQRLSERRAASVKAFLVTHGVDEERLRAVGYGEREPIAASDTEDGRARNRRVEMYIVTLAAAGEGLR